MKKILFLCLITLLTGCKNDLNRKNDLSCEDDLRCTCPPCIHLQPLDDFSRKEAIELKKQMEKHAPYLFYDDMLVVDSAIHLDNTYLNKTKTRYRAEKILNKFNDENLDFPPSDHNIYIVITHKDISTTYKGREDWGVLGLSYKGKYVGVASTHRIKNPKRDFWKVVTHEFVHAYFSVMHCSEDNDSCIMQDAKGKAILYNKKGFCKSCDEKFRL